MGYNLTIVKKASEPSPDIEKLVSSIIPTANCMSRVAAEVSFQLPIQELPNFKILFLALDEHMEELNIASYGISITTLEEVFLKVAEGTNISSLKFSKEESLSDKIDDFELNKVKLRGNFTIFFTHFWALIAKRLNYFKRDKKGLVCEIILPCIIVVVGLCLSFIKFLYPYPAMVLSPALLNIPMAIPIQDNYTGFYKDPDFDGRYFNFLSSAGFDNKDVIAFDDYVFGQRNIDEKGLYGAYFINSIQENRYNYLALVIFF